MKDLPPRCEWDFSSVPAPLRRACYEWEIEREAHGGLPPWLTLTERQRRNIADASCPLRDSRTWPVKELEDPEDLRWARRAVSYPEGNERKLVTIHGHALQIDWSAGRPAVKKALIRWVDSVPTYKAKGKAGSWDKGGGGPKPNPEYIGAFRLHSKELSGPAARELLGYPKGHKMGDSTWSKRIESVQKKIDECRSRGSRVAYLESYLFC